MLIYPAIDIRGGRCVRLQQGDYGRETVFDDDPVAVARRWAELGAECLHLVDLDGAREGRPVNGETVRAIVKAVEDVIPCQLGGGLRTMDDVALARSWGVDRAIVGTRAVKDPEGFEAICDRYPFFVALGLDARDGRVATDGWLEVSDVPAVELARRFASWPISAVIYTDISKDGMMQGPNFDGMAELARALRGDPVGGLPVIASGGVTTLEDVRRLARLGLAGCIIGRALYEGRIELPAAVAAAHQRTEDRGQRTE